MSQSDKDEAGKLFVGGLHRQTTEETLKSYFESYGAVKDCVLMKEKETGFSRGFGFVTYVDPSCVSAVLNAKPHSIDSKTVDPKPCTPRHIQQQKKMSANQYTKGHKIFIGGISMDASETDVKAYFERYGSVIEVVFVVNKQDLSRPHKGFGFVTFEDESSVDQACAKHYHMIKEKRVEAKKAESREKMDKANQNYNMGYGGGQGQMQGNMGYQQQPPQQGMNQGQNNWMGSHMMQGYGYGNQNFPTAYPQPYNNQAYGYGYGNMQGSQGYGNMQQPQAQGYGSMQPPQQQMGNMQGYGGMQPNPGMMGGGMGQQGNMPNNANNGGDMGNYQQNQSSYGPTKPSGDYNNMGGGMRSDYGNQNQMGGGASGGYGPPKQSGNSNAGYHPYRR